MGRYRTLKADIAMQFTPTILVTCLLGMRISGYKDLKNLWDVSKAQDFDGILLREPTSPFIISDEESIVGFLVFKGDAELEEITLEDDDE